MLIKLNERLAYLLLFLPLPPFIIFDLPDCIDFLSTAGPIKWCVVIPLCVPILFGTLFPLDVVLLQNKINFTL
jgi:hypothetical protein